ncbi:hypothetical protein DGMP_37460 [Desulfomarina profundi]|uniref:Transporter n=1 Tax=Desulfomarina profundi TaxID=2772557 RepID=A0A8D5FPS8_9BACT|nr:hypothetical protein [Desulfomarina profundi]BCL63053.1 hypothetical protein DGMP_37460 [Desulfomarina profundi]
MRNSILFITLSMLSMFQIKALADGNSAQDIAKKLANPVAAMYSLPIQMNYTRGYGADDEGDQYLTNIQPVLPFSLNDDWNLISRTILPAIRRNDIPSGNGVQWGIGDVVQSAFFSPSKVEAGDWIWGVGPVLLLPTGTNNLSAEKWGLGPTGVALKQSGPWTVGALANHIWDVGGSDKVVDDISATFLQPFLSYSTKGGLTYTALTESTYDWENHQWTVPIILVANQLTKIGDQMLTFGAGVSYTAEASEAAQEGFGFRLVFTMLWPR